MIDYIRTLLQKELAPLSLVIQDNSYKHIGHAQAKTHGGGHYHIKIVSKCFEGKTSLQRHRMVYRILKKQFSSSIHALSIQALTPQET